MINLKKADKVIKIDTTQPLMTVVGIKVKGNFPGYSSDEEMVTCDFID